MNKSTLHKHIQSCKKVKGENPEEFQTDLDERKEIEVLMAGNK